MDISQAARDKAATMAEGFEGFRSAPYQDVGGVWTYLYGTTRDPDGNPVTANTPPGSPALGQQLLERDMRAAFAAVQGSVSVPLTDDQEAALAEFIYNVGAGNFDHSTLLRELNAGNYEAAAKQFLVWDEVKGQVFAGLLRRRQAEKTLFETQESAQAAPSAPAVAPVAAPAAPPEGSWLTNLLQIILRSLQSRPPTQTRSS